MKSLSHAPVHSEQQYLELSPTTTQSPITKPQRDWPPYRPGSKSFQSPVRRNHTSHPQSVSPSPTVSGSTLDIALESSTTKEVSQRKLSPRRSEHRRTNPEPTETITDTKTSSESPLKPCNLDDNRTLLIPLLEAESSPTFEVWPSRPCMVPAHC